MARERSAASRMRRGRNAGRLLPALFCALLPVFAHSGPQDRDGREDRRAQRYDEAPQQRYISLDQAIAIAERRYKARVVRATTTESEGRRYHVLRMLSEEGRVWTVRIDAATGQER